MVPLSLFQIITFRRWLVVYPHNLKLGRIGTELRNFIVFLSPTLTLSNGWSSTGFSQAYHVGLFKASLEYGFQCRHITVMLLVLRQSISYCNYCLSSWPFTTYCPLASDRFIRTGSKFSFYVITSRSMSGHIFDSPWLIHTRAKKKKIRSVGSSVLNHYSTVHTVRT